MIKRQLEERIAQHLKIFPIVLIVGPRQSGKTTLARNMLPAWKYFDLERPGDFDRISKDPEIFFDENRSKIILDEAQRWPEIFPILRSVVDENHARPGQFILTGSSNPSLQRQAGESLAGRVGTLELAPLQFQEIAPRLRSFKERWFWGGYPSLYKLKSAPQKRAWLDSYIDTFLNRDIPSLGLRIPPARLRKLWTMAAHLHGGILNLSELGQSLDLSHHTVGHYLDILEDTFVIRRLQPFYANIRKRLIKSPKIYIRDSGILHNLLGLHSIAALENWPKKGASWEGAVIEELSQRIKLKYPSAQLYYWRTQAGAEVDLLVDLGLKKIAIEIKLGSAVHHPSISGLRQCMEDLKLKRGYILYGGSNNLSLGRGIKAIPWNSIEKSGLFF